LNAHAKAGPGRTADNDNAETRAKTAKPLPVIDPTTWQGVPVREREWFVRGWIPSRTVTLLSGDGGTGKSQLALQLVAASALQCDWLGLPVAVGPCLFYTAEDEADELHKRLACIVEHNGRRLADLTGIRLIPMVDRDPVLGAPDRNGQIEVTPTFVQLCEAAP
jgi:RecA-family ATPase